jgi:hypothetical protein
MTTEEEVLDYLLVNKLLTINTELTGQTLKITFTGDIPTKYRFYATSLLLEADANIESIVVTDANYSCNGIGTNKSLINLSWDGKVLIPPEQTAETWVSKTESSHNQNDANIAVDYVMMVPEGPNRDLFRSRLCSISQITLPENFCNLGIESHNNSCDFSVFPNPTNNELIIDFFGKTNNKNKIIEIYNLTGKLFLKENFLINTPIIYLNNYPSGIYILKIQIENSFYFQKICKLDK